MEQLPQKQISTQTKLYILQELLKCQNFDHFLANKFVSFKRYGCEGAESLIAFFIELFRSSTQGKFLPNFGVGVKSTI